MLKTVAAYFLIVLIYYGSIYYGSTLAGDYSIWLSALGAAVAVGIGASLGRVGAMGLAVTFLCLTFIFPICVGYIIGVKAGIESPLQGMLQDFEWGKVVLAFLSATVTYTALRIMCSDRWRIQCEVEGKE